MATRPQPPSERDLELLSAYLDGELSDRERVSLEKRLSQESTLRAALDGLRETVTLVRSLPRLKAPRNFTLDPATYGQPVPWWKRLFSLGNVLQVSGALGAAASIVIIALAFLLSGQSASEEGALSQPLHAEIEQTAVGYAAETRSSTPTLPPTTSPTASMQKAFTPTWTPLPSEAADDQDGAVASGVADTAVMPTPETESAILIEPAPSEPDAAPPGVVGQTAEEGISAEGGAASEQAAENGVFAAVPGPTGTLSPTQVSVQAYDSAGEAEAPLLAETPTSAPAVEELQESATSTTTLRPSPTATETQIAATATEDKGEKTGSDEAAMRRASEERDRETNDTRWLIAGLGAVLFVASVIVFIVGRRKR